MFTPENERTAEQAARVAMDDVLIAELMASDVIVLGVPMYNFGVSSQIKNWIDAVTRARVTFRYTESGVEGLVKGKTVYVAFARGGRYRGTEADTVTPYLRTILGFMGMTDVKFIYAEGLNMGEDSVTRGFAEAEADMVAALA